MEEKTIGVIFAVLVLVIFIILFVFKLIEKIDNRSHSDRRGHRFKFFASEDELPEIRGIQGEKNVTRSLRRLIKDDGYLLTNLLLPLDNGDFTEIDAILISEKGLFCIEIKNWVGRISGTDDSEIWIQQYDDLNRHDKPHENLVKQNHVHCVALDRLLNKEYEIISAVIFWNIEEKGELYSSYTCTLREFKAKYKHMQIRLDSEDIDRIYDILKGYQASEDDLERHKEQLRAHHKN